MQWLWIILRYLFPADPIRQIAEAMRHRVAQLVHVGTDEATLAELLINPTLRLHLELAILDAEDCLRLWIAMRGCQIARMRPGLPARRATPHPTRAKDLPELLARIAALVTACAKMEERAQAHAEKLKQLRDADPLAQYTPAHHAARPHPRSSRRTPGSRADFAACPGLKLQTCSRGATVPGSRLSSGRAVTACGSGLASQQGPPYSIAGANP